MIKKIGRKRLVTTNIQGFPLPPLGTKGLELIRKLDFGSFLVAGKLIFPG